MSQFVISSLFCSMIFVYRYFQCFHAAMPKPLGGIYVPQGFVYLQSNTKTWDY